MLNKNDVVTLEITALTNEGSGVGHYGADENSRGMAVFVPFTAVGDVISCRIVKVLKSYAYGRLEAILTASPDRVENYCPVYGKCGGCCFRHISYEAELRAKEGFVRDAFGRIGGLSPEMLPIRGSESVDGYRNKLQMPLSRQDGRTVCGFFSERSHRVIPTEKCALQPEIFAEIANLSLNRRTGSAFRFITRKSTRACCGTSIYAAGTTAGRFVSVLSHGERYRSSRSSQRALRSASRRSPEWF